jgi:hypothetical protein
MRIVTRGILATLAGAGLIVITLAGCATPASPLSTPTPSAMHTPVFASDEEALKAATEAYAAYLAMSDTIAQEGGINPERIKDYVTSSQYEIQDKDLADFRARGYLAQGSSKFDSARLQQRSENTVGIYVCVDVTDVRLLDVNGTDVTPSTRPNRLPIEVQLIASVAHSERLLVDESKLWSGQNFC